MNANMSPKRDMSKIDASSPSSMSTAVTTTSTLSGTSSMIHPSLKDSQVAVIDVICRREKTQVLAGQKKHHKETSVPHRLLQSRSSNARVFEVPQAFRRSPPQRRASTDVLIEQISSKRHSGLVLPADRKGWWSCCICVSSNGYEEKETDR
jgi:hypothetical protein